MRIDKQTWSNTWYGLISQPVVWWKKETCLFLLGILEVIIWICMFLIFSLSLLSEPENSERYGLDRTTGLQTTKNNYKQWKPKISHNRWVNVCYITEVWNTHEHRLDFPSTLLQLNAAPTGHWTECPSGVMMIRWCDWYEPDMENDVTHNAEEVCLWIRWTYRY